MPQVKFLLLLDKLGILHKAKKQVFGHVLEILGFKVDPNRIIIMLSNQRKDHLVATARAFVTHDTGLSTMPQQPLVEWQRMLGELNCGLNIMPLACPALSSSYAKIAHEPGQLRRQC